MTDKTRANPNAAYLLAACFREWRASSTQHAQVARGFDPGDNFNLHAWRVYIERASLVRVVDSTLQGMDGAGEYVDMFMNALPRWYAAAYMATTPWDSVIQNTERDVCSPGDIDLLDSLGALIDAADPITVGEDARRRLSDVLGEAVQLLEAEHDEIPRDIRRYLWGLIARTQMIVDNLEHYGPEVVRQNALELGGAMTSMGESLEQSGNSERGRRWRAVALMLLGGFMSKSGEQGAQAVGWVAREAAKQIGS